MDNRSSFENTKEITKKYKIPNTVKITIVNDIIHHENSRIYLVPSDSLTTATEVKCLYSSILVLSFANNFSFCDGKYIGSTQEEDICQRTNLYQSLGHDVNNDFYPIADPESDPTFLLSSDVVVVKNKNSSVIKPFSIDIITSATTRGPRQVTCALVDDIKDDIPDFDQTRYMYEADRIIMQNKIKNVVSMGTQYDVLIVGAWGCGVFAHPIWGTIQIWNDLLSRIKVRHVLFAIPPGRTYNLFKRYLSTRN